MATIGICVFRITKNYEEALKGDEQFHYFCYGDGFMKNISNYTPLRMCNLFHTNGISLKCKSKTLQKL
jgi:hypothetical protein